MDLAMDPITVILSWLVSLFGWGLAFAALVVGAKLGVSALKPPAGRPDYTLIWCLEEELGLVHTVPNPFESGKPIMLPAGEGTHGVPYASCGFTSKEVISALENMFQVPSPDTHRTEVGSKDYLAILHFEQGYRPRGPKIDPDEVFAPGKIASGVEHPRSFIPIRDCPCDLCEDHRQKVRRIGEYEIICRLAGDPRFDNIIRK